MGEKISDKYMAMLESAPKLRFIGGPEDGMEIIWIKDLPVRSYAQDHPSLGGIPVTDTYRADPDDPTMLRMVYAGRKLAASGNGKAGRTKRNRRHPPSR